MGRVSFSQENKKSTNSFEYPKMKLVKGETARIVVGLEDPVVGYVHTLQKPKVQDGVVRKVTAERKNGDTYETYKKDFVSNALCTGAEDVLDEKGIDPKRCLMCALHVENPEYTAKPKRRYAMHVARYRTSGNSGNVQEPFSMFLEVWGFTDLVFNKLSDLRQEMPNGDLRQHDLILGPCSDEGYQKFDIRPSIQQAEWKQSKERGMLLLDVFKNNQIPDLMVAVGNKKQESWIKQDIETVREAWAEVRAIEDGKSGSTASLKDGLSTLLDKETATKPDATDDSWATPEQAAEATGQSTAEMDDLLAQISGSSIANGATPPPAAEESAPAAEAPAATEAAPAEEKSDAPEASFEDLLAQMNKG